MTPGVPTAGMLVSLYTEFDQHVAHQYCKSETPKTTSRDFFLAVWTICSVESHDCTKKKKKLVQQRG